MSEQTDAYRKAIEDIIVNYDGANDQYQKIDNAATSPCDVNQIVNNMPNMTVVRDNGGNVIGYDYKYTGPNNVDTTDMEIDSNSGGSSFGTATGGGGSTRGGGTGRFVGHFDNSNGFQAATDNDGNPIISAFVDSAWAAVSTAAKFGKNVNDAAYDFMHSVGEYTADTFHDLLVQSADNGANFIRALFGVDSQGNTTMYVDEDTVGAYAIALRDNNFFVSGGQDYPDTFPSGANVQVTGLGSLTECINTAISRRAGGYTFYDGFQAVLNNFYSVYGANAIYVVDCYTSDSVYSGQSVFNIIAYPVTIGDTVTIGSSPTPRLRLGGSGRGGGASPMAVTSASVTVDGSFYGAQIQTGIWSSQSGRTTVSNLNATEVPSVPGVSDQTGATIPVDAITGADPHVVGQNLANQYPQVMGDPIQIVVLDDSCNEVTKKYYSIPISYSPTNINASVPITGGLQLNPSFNPDVQLDLPDIDMSKYTEQIINQLRGSGTGEVVVIDPNTGDPEILDPEPPNTGAGVTPPEVLPEADVKAMWHVYNPSSSQLSSFGSWMWDQTIIDQIIRLFNNPMEAIIGLHAVYVEPNVSGSSAIVVGNLASSVSANIVNKQYKSLNCGSVWLTEYFGNVFDYAPFTKVKLYLPFIGIVNLNVADVMRGEITVQYMVDVYTGACTATVSVNRDGAGGVLYQYSGNCAAEYPVSGASYSRMWQALASTVAVGLGGAASGNIAGAAGSMVATAMQAKVDVVHSGSFSGNPGAMGIKKPYLIITRPQTNMAIDYEHYDGRGSNYTARVGDCSGYIKCKEVHLNVPGAYADELVEIEQLLKYGILV